MKFLDTYFQISKREGGDGVKGEGGGKGVDLLVLIPVKFHLICDHVVFPFGLVNL